MIMQTGKISLYIIFGVLWNLPSFMMETRRFLSWSIRTSDNGFPSINLEKKYTLTKKGSMQLDLDNKLIIQDLQENLTIAQREPFRVYMVYSSGKMVN